LHGWVDKFHPNYKNSQLPPVDFSADNKRLRKELSRVTMERDILKKAAAYFANEAL